MIPVKYNLRSLLVRRVSTAMTVLSIAFVIAVFIGTMALARGLESVLVSTGEPLNIMVLRRNAGSELGSYISRGSLQDLKFLPGVKTQANGGPLASGELVVVLNLPKRGEAQGANVTLRGLPPEGLALRPQVRLVEGRMFQPGLREVIVSRSVMSRFQNTGLGERLRFGKGEWQVVGIFDAARTAFDSEIWLDVNQLASDFTRDSYSSVLLQATDSTAMRSIIDRIEQDRRYNLTAQPEVAYYRAQTLAAGPIRALGIFIAFIMGIGACFAAMNAMDAAVASRTQEIVTLRVLGFRRRDIVLSFMSESLILALSGGILGCLLVLPLNGVTTGTANWRTFSEIAFAFQVTGGLLLAGIIFSLLIGLLGGILPTRRAMRQSPASVLASTAY